MKNYDITIIGGGAAGMMAAIWASNNGMSVLIIEKNNKLGKKVYATGNGRCNLTNVNIDPSRYHGANFEFINNVLSGFDQFKTIKFFNKLGVLTKEEVNGRIFPKSDKAKSVVIALENELKRNNVSIMYNLIVKCIKKSDVWSIMLASGKIINSQKLIISTGGNVASQFGSSGDAYEWAKSLGHSIVPVSSALVPIETKEEWVKNLQGVSIKANVKIVIDDVVKSEKFADLLFTHFGLTGPAIMSQSLLIAKNIDSNIIQISIDFFSDASVKEMDDLLKNLFNTSGAKTVKNCLSEIIQIKIAEQVLSNLGINTEVRSAEISKTDRSKLVNELKNFEFMVKGIRPQSEAQVTSGGISCDEINSSTMESKIVSNLYFAGEVVDVDGDSGGFNLQWAWSSGHLAGNSASF
jgi:hypothetical protein